MIGKIANPKKSSNASARGNVRYILGYELGSKAVDGNQAYHSLLDEARARADRGVGTIWSPTIGDGTRPSSVYAQGLNGLATAGIEMDGWASANKRAERATHHEIFSFGEEQSKKMTDEMAIDAVRMTYIKVYGEEVGRRMTFVAAVHRDTPRLHVHVALGAIDTGTGKALERTRSFERYDRAMRNVELEMGLEHDNGLSCVKHYDGIAIVEDTTLAQRQAWRREESGHVQARRQADLERKSTDAIDRADFARYVDTRVEPAIRKELPQPNNRKPHTLLQTVEKIAEDIATQNAVSMIDIHNLAAREGMRLERQGYGENVTYVMRDVSTAEFTARQKGDLAAWKAGYAGDSQQFDLDLKAFEKDQAQALADEFSRLQTEGRTAELSPDVRAALFRVYRDVDDAEAAFVRCIEHNPSFVSEQLTIGESTFSREDIDAYLAARISDAGEVYRLSEHIIANDKTLVLRSVGVSAEVWTTKEMIKVESHLAKTASKMAKGRVDGYDPAMLERALDRVTDEKRKTDPEFKWSDEQRAALSRLDRGLSVIEGRAGTGKTTIMQAVKEHAKGSGKEIVGVTISASAADKLEHEAGFVSLNSAKALSVEGDNNQRYFPKNGILIIDEAGMVDSRTMDNVLSIADKRNCQVMLIGDRRQLAAIGAGNGMDIVVRASQEAGTFKTLDEIYRQDKVKQPLLHKAARDFGDGIHQNDADKILSAYKALDQNGSIQWSTGREGQIKDAAAWYVAHRRANPNESILVTSYTRQTVRKLNETIRADLGFVGGRSYRTVDGARQFQNGDTIIFKKNHDFAKDKTDYLDQLARGAGLKRKYDKKPDNYEKPKSDQRVNNGDTATIEKIHRNGYITVRLAGDADGKDKGKKITFHPREMPHIDWGYACSTHSAQGASVVRAAAVNDPNTPTQAVGVQQTRAKIEYVEFVDRNVYRDLNEVAAVAAGNIQHKGTTQDISRVAQEATIAKGDQILLQTDRRTLRALTVTSVEPGKVFAEDAAGVKVEFDPRKAEWKQADPTAHVPYLAKNRRATASTSEAGDAYVEAMTQRQTAMYAALNASHEHFAKQLATAGLDPKTIKEIRSLRAAAEKQIAADHAPSDRATFVQNYERDAEALKASVDKVSEIRKARTAEGVSPTREIGPDRSSRPEIAPATDPGRKKGPNR